MSDEQTKSIKYDLACGGRKQDGYTGVDKENIPGVDIVYDLENYPWTSAADNSIDEIYSSMYVEHTKDIMKFMDECYRILRVGGTLTLIAPYWSSIRSWQDPTHLRVISEGTFLYYNREWREKNLLMHYPIKSDFDFSFGFGIDTEWQTKNSEAIQFAIKHYSNVALDIQVNLVKRG